MSASPVNSLGLAALFTAVLFLAVPAPAWAQASPAPLGAPVRLTPPPLAGAPPAPDTPAPPAPNPPGAPPLPRRLSVQLDTPPSLDPASAGGLAGCPARHAGRSGGGRFHIRQRREHVGRRDFVTLRRKLRVVVRAPQLRPRFLLR